MEDKKNITLDIGTIINEKWVILEFIAKGGMGEIYRAHQLDLKRDVAIKVISKEWLLSWKIIQKNMQLDCSALETKSRQWHR